MNSRYLLYFLLCFIDPRLTACLGEGDKCFSSFSSCSSIYLCDGRIIDLYIFAWDFIFTKRKEKKENLYCNMHAWLLQYVKLHKFIAASTYFQLPLHLLLQIISVPIQFRVLKKHFNLLEWTGTCWQNQSMMFRFGLSTICSLMNLVIY